MRYLLRTLGPASWVSIALGLVIAAGVFWFVAAP